MALLVWPLQIIAAAIFVSGAWLIDSALRDVVANHARPLRHALAPVPMVFAGLAIAATFVWPNAIAVALAFLGVTVVVYVCCEAVALFRRR